MNASLTRRLAAVAVFVLLVAGVVTVATGDERNRLTAEFPSTINLFAGAKVKVLGVVVGEVTDIEVRGTKVRVEIVYDAGRALPADVHAVIVPPSIVGDRFVQLTPVYRGGPKLPEGARLGLDRTTVPVELDDTYRAVDQLVTALGPKGANADGALSRLISATADHLGGNGKRYNKAMKDLADAIGVFSAGREDIAGTVTNLSRLSKRFARDDGTVRSLIHNLTAVSSQLNSQRDEIGAATDNLAGALRDVSEFIAKNKESLTGNLSGLTKVSGTLAKHTGDLAEMLDIAPLGLTNFVNIYQPTNWDFDHPERSNPEGRTGVLMQRVPNNDLYLQLGHAMTVVCGQLPSAQRAELDPLCTALRQAGGNLGAIVERLIDPSQGDGQAISLFGLLGGGR